ncbi:hypothetical protein A2U01_0076627, partial [Trifolium medium]|nr:hypothetical protein [Trifolium medium]
MALILHLYSGVRYTTPPIHWNERRATPDAVDTLIQ